MSYCEPTKVYKRIVILCKVHYFYLTKSEVVQKKFTLDFKLLLSKLNIIRTSQTEKKGLQE